MEILKIKQVTLPEWYLGLPSSVCHKKIDSIFYIKGRIWKYLQLWKGNVFSSGGKEVIIKTVVQAIPSYSMSCFKLPKGIIAECNHLMAKFW